MGTTKPTNREWVLGHREPVPDQVMRQPVLGVVASWVLKVVRFFRERD